MRPTTTADPHSPVLDDLHSAAHCDNLAVPSDPPPPYPSRDRRSPRSTRPNRRLIIHPIQTSNHSLYPSSDSQYEQRTSPASPAPHTDDDLVEPTEATLLLAPPLSRRGRPRSYSHASTTSAAPSLAQTVFSLFQADDDEPFSSDSHRERPYLSEQGRAHERTPEQRRSAGFFSIAEWRRYFRPLVRREYYSSFCHLAIINFPYALAAWVYLFVFTVTGTTLLMALPLGAVLCFCNLLGARAFSRGELAVQSHFHYPLSYPPPYPPRPIFTRYREPTLSEIESRRASPHTLIREPSFYKNTYAMFTDSTSYQALFYFLVIKPAITLLLTIAIWAAAIPAMCLVLPAPAVLRAIRKLGRWQADIAIEGLYLVVR